MGIQMTMTMSGRFGEGETGSPPIVREREQGVPGWMDSNEEKTWVTRHRDR